jgi:sugar phosphate isomerase/epimerase
VVIRLGVDTLTYHLRLESGTISVDEVLQEAAELGCECVQVTLHHVRDQTIPALERLRRRAADLGLTLLASGDVLGRRYDGDGPTEALARVEVWLERALALGSSSLRVVSGFYRADLAHRPDLIEAERQFIVEALRGAAPVAMSRGVMLLLENHSDFRADEYRSIIAEVGPEHVGVFLDLINPISGFEDPVAVVNMLAPYARAGHVKDYSLRSVPTDDGYHRRGFDVRWCYPGEGAADLRGLIDALQRGLGGRPYQLTIEALDNSADRQDQPARLRASLALMRELVRE